MAASKSTKSGLKGDIWIVAFGPLFFGAGLFGLWVSLRVLGLAGTSWALWGAIGLIGVGVFRVILRPAIDPTNGALRESVQALLADGEVLLWLSRFSDRKLFHRSYVMRVHSQSFRSVLLAGTDRRVAWIGVAGAMRCVLVKELPIGEVDVNLSRSEMKGKISYLERGVLTEVVLRSPIWFSSQYESRLDMDRDARA